MRKEYIISEEDLGCDGAYFSYEELIRCKVCINNEYGFCCLHEFITQDLGYCHFAEKREVNNE